MSKLRTSQANPASVDGLITRADELLARLEQWLPGRTAPVDWDASIALRWRRKPAAQGVLEPILQVHRIDLRDLHGIDEQKQRVERNTRQFVDGHPANNVLLTGARGTGKSSLIKALLNKYAPRGLRLIDPLGYLDFLKLMSNATLVLTDSGGIQEETTILQVPCITLRENTERPVTAELGTNQIVGTDPATIIQAYRRAIDGNCAKSMIPPLWDGRAAERIVATLLEELQ